MWEVKIRGLQSEVLSVFAKRCTYRLIVNPELDVETQLHISGVATCREIVEQIMNPPTNNDGGCPTGMACLDGAAYK